MKLSHGMKWFFALAKITGLSASNFRFRMVLNFGYSCAAGFCIYIGCRDLFTALISIALLHVASILRLIIAGYFEKEIIQRIFSTLNWSFFVSIIITMTIASYKGDSFEWVAFFEYFAYGLVIGFWFWLADRYPVLWRIFRPQLWI